MVSKWYRYKSEAILLRTEGNSIRNIEKKLKIPRSTLSGWFKNIKLTDKQKNNLKIKSLKGLKKARKMAILWHKKQKENRITKTKTESLNFLSQINFKNKSITELALAMLYLGEGSKSNGIALGNSNPLIVYFFVKSLSNVYNIKISNIKCDLHLRSDQDVNKLTKFWSRKLKLPAKNFKSYIDSRTVKSKTYPEYKGVCVVRCGNVALMRRMIFISQGFCEKITKL